MPFQRLEMPVAAGLLKNSRLAHFIVYFDGGVHDLTRAIRPSAGKNRSGVYKIFTGTDANDSAKIGELSPCFVRDQSKNNQDYEEKLFFPAHHLLRLGSQQKFHHPRIAGTNQGLRVAATAINRTETSWKNQPRVTSFTTAPAASST
jgi:hypothetical protein